MQLCSSSQHSHFWSYKTFFSLGCGMLLHVVPSDTMCPGAFYTDEEQMLGLLLQENSPDLCICYQPDGNRLLYACFCFSLLLRVFSPRCLVLTGNFHVGALFLKGSDKCDPTAGLSAGTRPPWARCPMLWGAAGPVHLVVLMLGCSLA